MDSATSTTAIVLAQMIVESPKNGAMSRAAAISVPRVETPTANTRTSSSPGRVRTGSAVALTPALLVEQREVRLARAADGAEPVARDVLEGRSGRDATVGVALGGVVDEAAGLADPLLRRARRHFHQGTVGPVEVDRPAPGEELNAGEPTTPRQAATVIVLRGGAGGLEVLLVLRTPAARFMGGVWVFPGGAVDAHEGEGDAAHRAAGVREVREEAGLELGEASALVRFSRW